MLTKVNRYGGWDWDRPDQSNPADGAELSRFGAERSAAVSFEELNESEPFDEGS